MPQPHAVSAVVAAILLGTSILTGCGTTQGPPVQATPTMTTTGAAPTLSPSRFAAHGVNGVTVRVPKKWKRADSPSGVGLRLVDPSGNANLVIRVDEVVRNSLNEQEYDAAAYLGASLNSFLDESGSLYSDEAPTQTPNPADPVQPLDVPGADNAASVHAKREYGGTKVEYHFVAAQSGILVAVVSGSQSADVLDDQTWDAILHSVQIDPSTLEAS